MIRLCDENRYTDMRGYRGRITAWRGCYDVDAYSHGGKRRDVTNGQVQRGGLYAFFMASKRSGTVVTFLFQTLGLWLLFTPGRYNGVFELAYGHCECRAQARVQGCTTKLFDWTCHSCTEGAVQSPVTDHLLLLFALTLRGPSGGHCVGPPR